MIIKLKTSFITCLMLITHTPSWIQKLEIQNKLDNVRFRLYRTQECEWKVRFCEFFCAARNISGNRFKDTLNFFSDSKSNNYYSSSPQKYSSHLFKKIHTKFSRFHWDFALKTYFSFKTADVMKFKSAFNSFRTASSRFPANSWYSGVVLFDISFLQGCMIRISTRISWAVKKNKEREFWSTIFFYRYLNSFDSSP